MRSAEAVETFSLGRSAGHERQVELLVFLLLIVPSLLLSFVHGGAGRSSFPLLAVSVIARDLALVSLVLFFLWRNGESFQALGWRLKPAMREVGLGVLLFIPLQLGASGLEWVLRDLGLSSLTRLPSTMQPSGTGQLILGVLLVLVVAVSEETIFRGYLILRLRSWTRSLGAVVFASSVIFALGHGYEGMAGVITVGVMGAAFALIYLWRRTLTAAITLHFLVDLASIVVMPALGHR